jgi:hypothetical protein
VSADFSPQLWSAFRDWWREQQRSLGPIGAASLLVRELWQFLRDSTPERRRQRYGDMEYDWEQRVNTTSGTVSWQARLLGVFHSPYQPTEPALFREMMATLPIDFREFTFIDIGSGKGRTLLMASGFPFRRIIGVELIPELHYAAEENICAYQSATQQCRHIEPVLADAREFDFPLEPLLLYFFNPLPERALLKVLGRLEESRARAPRACWVVYHNPLLDEAFGASAFLEKTVETPQYFVYRTVLSS